MVDPNETAAGTGASETSVQQWGTGSVVGDGRYRLTRRLGRGGMAEVFAAEDVRLGRIVAVKLLRGDLAEDPVAKARFTREAQAVAGLNHHAVVAVYDSGEDSTPGGTAPYIVMELVEGHTIKDLLTSATPPPVDQALLIVSGVLDALAYSHQHGIVHRDIKPANVIITTGGAVKVMDFGIARALHGAASTMTQTGMVMGTPQYLSPEQALGKSVDHRSDLYATGCLLYELLALRPPFVGETPLSVVYQHVQDEPRLPSQVSERVPPELDGLVLRSLAKQPEERFQSADEMRGVVGYAHQALTQQGGWTGGMWDTGAITAVLPEGQGRTSGVGGYRPDGRSGSTAELNAPLVPGVVGGTGAGSGAGGYDDGTDGGSGNRWLKPVLFTVAAVLAVVIGVVLATQGGGHGDNPADNQQPSSSTSAPTEQQPTDEQPTDQPTDEPTDTGAPTTDPGKPSWTPSTSAPPSTPATTPPTQDTPTSKPTKTTPPPTDDTPSSTPTGGDSTDKPTDKPTDGSSGD